MPHEHFMKIRRRILDKKELATSCREQEHFSRSDLNFFPLFVDEILNQSNPPHDNTDAE